MENRAEEILNNIIDLAELLDEETLRNAADVPIIELAKSVSIQRRAPQRREPACGARAAARRREAGRTG
ncbi:MAG TPA: hypothetical protein VNL14_10720 [Candidatus Acidoferrales bacterium]|nr:hypothetical protein [Candidatus Acidoferrales bacterium]